MDRIRAWIRAFFGFSRTETNGFIILLPLLLIILFSEPLYRKWRTTRAADFPANQLLSDSLMAQFQLAFPDSLNEPSQPSLAAAFAPFDPNKASVEEFIRLGLSAPVSKRIVHYREQGGVFRKKEDLAKIYGLDSAWFRQATPWIRLPQATARVTASVPEFRRDKTSVPIVADVNEADSLQLLSVFGVGPSLSKRIRTFRQRLGGFVTMEQLKEVYGLDSTVVSRLRTHFFVGGNFQPRKLRLNEATAEELAMHPYIRWKEAQAIVAFRLQHGNFQTLDQLGEIKVLSASWCARVIPYLTVE